jgi:hypothetical protein
MFSVVTRKLTIQLYLPTNEAKYWPVIWSSPEYKLLKVFFFRLCRSRPEKIQVGNGWDRELANDAVYKYSESRLYRLTVLLY